ncbi:MAG: type 4a pilus biogenesis protein PilO [Patescibacteria group bacterium]|nr:type 4a pilus biogenesis protein PilO [Patescibacteria group bacterium]
MFFAIRPNLVTAFTLQQELEQLRAQDEQYENVILNIVKYQSLIENTRDDFVLLEDAVPDSPEIFNIVRDIRIAATASGLIINELEISQVVLKDTPKDADGDGNIESTKNTERQSYTIRFNLPAGFTDVRNFMARLTNQRRLKTVEAIRVNTTTQPGTSSAVFNFSFDVTGYYLQL